jgi:hypothetical protein
MNYVYENNFAIGYMNGDNLIRFCAPIAAHLLHD